MTRCNTCDARLAHDQRYCVQCGTRRGQLPPRVAQLISQIRERGQAALPANVDPGGRAGHHTPRAQLAAEPARSRLDRDGDARLRRRDRCRGDPVGARHRGQRTGRGRAVDSAAAPDPDHRGPGDPDHAGRRGAGARETTPSAPASPATPATPATPTTPPSSTTPTTPTTPTNTNPYGLPAIKHVFVIMLGDAGYSQTFGSTDPYMSKTLPKQGKLVEFYYGVAGGELANELALVSGQGPTPQTEADCPTYANLAPGTISKRHQALGQGCVYPRKVKTLASQLTAAHLTSKAYIQGMDGSSARPGAACTRRSARPTRTRLRRPATRT